MKVTGLPNSKILSTTFAAMRILANAKINLGLFILRKRADTYHELNSFFIPIPWYDVIELSISNKFQFLQRGIEVDGRLEENLCVRAYRLMEAKFNLPAVKIELEKNIPIGAGLGGGSSDAASVLKGLNQFFELKLSQAELMQLAASLGSDCPFFIPNRPAIASGVGDRLDFNVDVSLDAYCLAVYPNIHSSTAEAYKQVKPKSRKMGIKAYLNFAQEEWKKYLINDFETPICRKYPLLSELKEQLYEMGAFFVSMSGSGSSFYAFFKEKPLSNLISEKYPRHIFKLAL